MKRFSVFALCAAVGLAGYGLGRYSRSAAPSPIPLAPNRPNTAANPATAATPSAVAAPAAATLAKRPAHSLAEDDERQKALEAWADTDPAAAMAYARETLKGDRLAQATTAILSVWGRHDPQGAWDWVTQNMPQALYHYDTLLEVFGRASTETAMKYANRYAAEHPEASVEVNLAALLGITYRGDFTGALAAIKANTSLPPDSQATLYNFLAGQWARFAPQDAATWVATLPPGHDREQALIGLGESWSEIDPAGAARYAVDLPEGNARTLALRQAIGKWVMTDADAARAWVLETNRHEDFDQAVGTIATDTNLVNRDPQRALRWAATIFDDKLRQQSVSTILFNWFPSDPMGATKYIESAADLSPAQRTELLGRLKASHGSS